MFSDIMYDQNVFHLELSLNENIVKEDKFKTNKSQYLI